MGVKRTSILPSTRLLTRFNYLGMIGMTLRLLKELMGGLLKYFAIQGSDVLYSGSPMMAAMNVAGALNTLLMIGADVLLTLCFFGLAAYTKPKGLRITAAITGFLTLLALCEESIYRIMILIGQPTAFYLWAYSVPGGRTMMQVGFFGLAVVGMVALLAFVAYYSKRLIRVVALISMVTSIGYLAVGHLSVRLVNVFTLEDYAQFAVLLMVSTLFGLILREEKKPVEPPRDVPPAPEKEPEPALAEKR